MASFASLPTPAMAQPAAPAAPPMSSPDSATATTTESSPEDALSGESPKGFISSLPSREGWPQRLIQYKGYWFKPGILEGVLRASRAFLPRADDVVLATQPKCGTTWLKALAFTVATRSRHGLGAADHPLLTRHAQHLVSFIEIPGATGGDDHIDLSALPSPRLLATHMPMSLLRPETRSLGCRVVYLCRDPKDTLVSRLHLENKLVQRGGLSMDDAYDMFCEGFSPYGPF